ncbi:MAG TPA: hypothetical protein ENK39_05350, partial [Epsilonproteobacteria bacterium]|nr:hypothetical protein [Campylobacterota bacterium]
MKRLLMSVLLSFGSISLSANVTANVGNGAFASVHKDKLYAVNGNTGKAQLIATVPATIGGVATNPSGGFNSLAINTTDGILYFVSNGTTSKAVFGYNMRTDTFLLIDADMIVNRGVTSLGRNLGSGGGFYANGRYFFGVENSGSGNSAVYSIATANNGTTFVGNAVLEVNSFAYQWGDFAIDGANGIMYTGSSGIGYQALDLGVMGTVGDETVINSNSSASFGQVGIDLGGQFYYVFGNTAGFATIDLVTGATGTGKSITVDGTNEPADGSYDAAGIVPFDSSIGDFVWNDLDGNGIQDAGEVGISGVTIELYDDINGDGNIDNGGSYNNTDTLLATDTTDASGNYKFDGLIPGSYIIKITDANGNLSLGSFSTAGGATQTALITQSQQFVDTVDFGYHVPKGSVSGTILDPSSNPIVGAQVKIVDTTTGATINDINGNPLLATVNPADGTYTFTDVPAGDYNIVEINPVGYGSVSDVDSSDDGDTIVNTDTNNDSIPVTVGDFEIDVDNNFIDTIVNNISGSVLIDTDNDNVGDTAPSAPVTVTLYEADGVTQATDAGGNLIPAVATNNATGAYSFTNVPAGNYIIKETNPVNHASLSDIEGINDDIIHVTSLGTVNSPVTGQNYVDAPISDISGTVLIDTNNDNTGDTAPSAPVSVTLYEADGTTLATDV